MNAGDGVVFSAVGLNTVKQQSMQQQSARQSIEKRLERLVRQQSLERQSAKLLGHVSVE